MNRTDEALVIASQNGGRSAFEELIRRTARLVYARIYLETGDRHRTEDLVQETFLTAWRSIGQVTRPEGLRPWLLTVAQSVVVDARRRDGRKKRAGVHVTVEALAGVAAGQPGPDEAAERSDERERVMEAMRSLPEEYRDALTLRYIAGADYETIGRQLGISNGSLRGLLSRGMAMLRERMT